MKNKNYGFSRFSHLRGPKPLLSFNINDAFKKRMKEEVKEDMEEI